MVSKELYSDSVCLLILNVLRMNIGTERAACASQVRRSVIPYLPSHFYLFRCGYNLATGKESKNYENNAIVL